MKSHDCPSFGLSQSGDLVITASAVCAYAPMSALAKTTFHRLGLISAWPLWDAPFRQHRSVLAMGLSAHGIS